MPAHFRHSLLSPVKPLEFRKRLFSSAMRHFWEKSVRVRHDGLALVDVSFRKDLQTEFVHQTTRALDLVRQKDLRRYQRISGCFDFIVHMELVGLKAQYWRWPPACVLDFSRFPFEKSPDAVLIILAATLVHEATHAFLFRRGIHHTAKTYIRIERICCLEETRFVGRVNSALGAGWMQRRFKSAELERSCQE